MKHFTAVALLGFFMAPDAGAETTASWQPLPGNTQQTLSHCQCEGKMDDCMLSLSTSYGWPPNKNALAGPGDYLFILAENGGVKVTKEEFEAGSGSQTAKPFYAKYFPHSHGGKNFGKEVLALEGQELFGKIHVPDNIRANIKALGKFDINVYWESSYSASGSKIVKTTHWYFTTSVSKDTVGVTETWEYEIGDGKVKHASYKADGSGYDKVKSSMARKAFEVIEFAHGLNSYHPFKDTYHKQIACTASPSDPPSEETESTKSSDSAE